MSVERLVLQILIAWNTHYRASSIQHWDMCLLHGKQQPAFKSMSIILFASVFRPCYCYLCSCIILLRCRARVRNGTIHFGQKIYSTFVLQRRSDWRVSILLLCFLFLLRRFCCCSFALNFWKQITQTITFWWLEICERIFNVPLEFKLYINIFVCVRSMWKTTISS